MKAGTAARHAEVLKSEHGDNPHLAALGVGLSPPETYMGMERISAWWAFRAGTTRSQSSGVISVSTAPVPSVSTQKASR